MRRFNITGKCIPSLHYMVDISDRLSVIKRMIDQGDYFCINRGRQYGKTTTLDALNTFLADGFNVFQISFEGLDDSIFASQETLMRAVFRLMRQRIRLNLVKNISDNALTALETAINSQSVDSIDFMDTVNEICMKSQKPVVLLIDEVDQAGNFESFVKFLGLLRNMYLDRNNSATFQSVILAGVYDIKNLKLKVRGQEEHQYNSPWNIAVPYEDDMSLSEEGIRGMLEDYEDDHHSGMDIAEMAQLLRDYTSGYPFLVSRLCLELDNRNDWTKVGFLSAVKAVLNEGNTLFDDLQKKLAQFPQMKEMFCNILYRGMVFPYNYADKMMEMATRFGFVSSTSSNVQISNRIFETYLYNYFVSELATNDPLFNRASDEKPRFINNGRLNMPLILERFCKTYTELYLDRNEKFDEEEGRKKFIFYIKPIINGVGNYYVEARTRGIRRTDLVIDYLGLQYIIEMKIWRGHAYNTKGELQLSDYLKANDKAEGYMLTFNFNKNKNTASQTKIVAGKKIIEYIV